jgi:hypothetical protein
MQMKSTRIPLAVALVLTTGMTTLAVSTKFSDFTPLTSSAAPLPVDGPEPGGSSRRRDAQAQANIRLGKSPQMY